MFRGFERVLDERFMHFGRDGLWQDINKETIEDNSCCFH